MNPVLCFIARFQERYAQNEYVQQGVQQASEWVQQQLPDIPAEIWTWLRSGFKGVLGAFGGQASGGRPGPGRRIIDIGGS